MERTKKASKNGGFHALWAGIAGAVVLVGIVVFFVASDRNTPEDAITEEKAKEVEVRRVGELSLNTSGIRVSGEVRSQTEAELATEVSGRLVGVYKQEGDFVGVGTIIAEVENATQRASVTQARASLASAQASLDKLLSGTREEDLSILKINKQNADDAFLEAKVQAVNTLKQVFVLSDDAIRSKTDPLFDNPRSSIPKLVFTLSTASLRNDIEQGRRSAETMLTSWESSIGALTAENNLDPAFSLGKSNSNALGVFLDQVALAVNSLEPDATLPQTTIDGWKANILLARTNVNTAFANISSAQNNITTKKGALDVAIQNLERGTTGERKEDVRSAEAVVLQALGGLASAQANLEKTLLRSPIRGTINSLDIERGDFVSAFAPLVVVSNNNALEVVGFITESDRKAVSVGSSVLIDGTAEGIVTRIAPSVDQNTKKVEIIIGFREDQSNFLAGQAVQIDINRGEVKEQGAVDISIPISSLRVGVENTVVFTVDGEGKLVAHAIVLGPIVGEKVVIREGVTADMAIVVDARGLREGESVVIKN